MLLVLTVANAVIAGLRPGVTRLYQRCYVEKHGHLVCDTGVYVYLRYTHCKAC